MLTVVAEFIDRRATRVGLITLGVAATIVLAPIAALGAYSGLVTVLFYRDSAYSELEYRIGLIGWGGLVGLSAAWCRVVARNSQFQRSRYLYGFTIVGLLIGLATAIAQLIGMGAKTSHPMFWVHIAVALVGFLLLLSTLGAKRLRSNSTVERDAPQAARPSL